MIHGYTDTMQMGDAASDNCPRCALYKKHWREWENVAEEAIATLNSVKKQAAAHGFTVTTTSEGVFIRKPDAES